MSLSERLSRIELLCDPRTAGDLAVIRTQLTRAEAKLLKGQRDLRREMLIVAERLVRAERRLAKGASTQG